MSNATGVQGITEIDIANYLANTPGFFERHAELLASVQLTSPHGQRAVSLQERQMEMLRDKIKGLESKIMEMTRHGQGNLTIADKLHAWTLALMQTSLPGELPEVLVRELLQRFTIPQGGLRIWGAADAFSAMSFANPVSDDVKSFASSLMAPYCGVNAGFEAAQWLDEPASAMSMALIPLRSEPGAAVFGMLVLASPDAARYPAEMGTEFLVRIGELAGAGLSRLLPPRV